MKRQTSKSPQANSEETHQTAGDGYETMTTQVGMPIADDQNSLKLGQRGPHLLEDQIFREKLFHFDHERIPERVVHARGYGAHGTFELKESLGDVTRARVLTDVGEKTEVFVRFSTVAGNKGSADLARDVRGFAVKFYTKEGNWDLVGNNIPVFFIQDAIKFPDLIHAAKQEPDRGFPQAQTAHDNFWDFMSLMPEAMHMVMWIMSDRTIPRSFRFMEGFGVHTFRLVNAQGESSFVGFGTLFTAEYDPSAVTMRLIWPDQEWTQALHGFREGRRIVQYPAGSVKSQTSRDFDWSAIGAATAQGDFSELARFVKGVSGLHAFDVPICASVGRKSSLMTRPKSGA